MSPAHASRGGIDGGAMALLVVPCLCNNNSGVCLDKYHLGAVGCPLLAQSPSCTSNLSAVPCSRVVNNGTLMPLVAPCLCNDGNGNSAQKGSGNGALTPLIPPCSCDMTAVVAVAALTTAPWHCWLHLPHVAMTVAVACKRVAMMVSWHCQLSLARAMMTTAAVRERAATIVRRSPMVLRRVSRI